MADQAPLRPPYAAFRTFWRVIEALHQEHRPLPQHLEKPVFGPMSGSARSQVTGALRFFGLIEDENRPTPRLHELVDQPTPEKLRALVEAHYKDAVALGLETATPRQLDNVLREMGAGQGDTLRRSRIFFIQAAREAGINIGRPLLAPSPPSGGSKPRRVAKPAASTASEPAPQQAASSARPGFTSDLHPFIQGLIQELPAPGSSFPASKQESWLDLARATFRLLYEIDEQN